MMLRVEYRHQCSKLNTSQPVKRVLARQKSATLKLPVQKNVNFNFYPFILKFKQYYKMALEGLRLQDKLPDIYYLWTLETWTQNLGFNLLCSHHKECT